MLYERILKPDGTFFEVHGPPYTQEEEDAFYARYAKGMMSGQATVVHRSEPPIEAAPTEPEAPATPQPPRQPQRSPAAEHYARELPYRRNLGFTDPDPTD